MRVKSRLRRAPNSPILQETPCRTSSSSPSSGLFLLSLIGQYLAGQVDSDLAVLVRVAIAAAVFIPFTRWRGLPATMALPMEIEDFPDGLLLRQDQPRFWC